MDSLELITVTLTLISISGFIFITFPLLLLLKGNKIRAVEDILEDGNRFYSLNIFMTGWGALHYATVFFSGWHAKRYNLYDKRNLVPKKLKIWFIVYYVFFMLLCCLFTISALITYFWLDKP